jgi:hypothetical protein
MDPQAGPEQLGAAAPGGSTPPPPPPPPPPRLTAPSVTGPAALPEVADATDAAVPPPAPLLPDPPVSAPAPVVDERVERVESAEPAEPGRFDPSVLRSEPPPAVLPTPFLRILLLLAQLVGIAVVVMVEYREGPDGLASSSIVVPPYLLAAALLVAWSALTMVNAARLVPATSYQRASSAPLVVVLWLLAFAAPFAAVRTIDWARDRFVDDADDTIVLAVTVAAVLVAALLVWMPFRYHVVQAHRIGVPGRVVSSWFWLPVVAGVGTLLIGWLGLSETLRENGMTDVERAVQVGVIFGLPALVFAFTTWRATTVFDEVIEIRWQRWSREWDDAVAAMSGRPMPQPGGPAS